MYNTLVKGVDVKNKELKIVTFANLKSGGKSSMARLVAEFFNASILNFDTKRNAEHYNAVSTINIQKDINIKRTSNELILISKHSEQRLKSKSGFLICDLGGYFDERLMNIGSDVYILPTFKDYESMRETLLTAHYILKHNVKAHIIFVLNGAMVKNKEGKKTAIKDWREQIKINGFQRFSNYYMPYSTLFEKLVDEGKKTEDIIGKNKLLLHSYTNVKNVIYQICEEIEDFKIVQ